MPTRGIFIARAVVAGLLISWLAQRASADQRTLDFNRDIRPILSNSCFACHGPDENKLQGGLRLDRGSIAVAAADSGSVPIVPGHPEQSELIARIESEDDSTVMPPIDSGKSLTAGERQRLRQWIQEGAPYAVHWSYAPLRRPEVPVLDTVSQPLARWPRNPVDHFVLQRLRREGLTPAAEPDRYVLVRRVALDLTGLPPTAAEASAFVNDSAPDAYERLVDRLLAKPAFGEHWARLWLDLARYADSAGYADDPPRTIWAYRDWVIRSLCANQPFDQFTIEQLAGDLLPQPTDDQLIATAFHRNTLTNNEGGTNDEEFRNVAIVDRVNTTMSVWMGTTIACAQCHNHKYDPISQEEYFQVFAIFNNTEDADLKDESPLLSIATEPATTVPIMRELPPPRRRHTHVQQRGNYLVLGNEVSAGLPAALLSDPPAEPPDRLALAQWLVSEDNPLTARVVANRYWEALFGTGLVRTSEEFGTQGELPSHPELLDWLATELVQQGWDRKHLIKVIVTSATYRQSSRVTEEAYQRDPDNRLFARGPRVRLTAEMVRDQALAVSGLLSPKMFGPPVQPLQPASGLSAAFGGGIDWRTSEGEDRYRRALYTTWRRSNPYPSLATFDAPNREVCTVRRDRTNTPLQALVTLNDPVYVEAAQALARRIVAEGGDTIAQRAAYGLQLCLVRPATEVETQRLVQLYQQARDQYAHDLDQAAAMATDPLGAPPQGADVIELAAWTVVSNILLNLDEMFMKL